jgi:hypothetical protein
VREPATGSTRQLASAFAIIAALTLVSAWRLLPQFGSALPSDLGDPVLNSWILWWNARAVPLTAAWWNAPMFAPLTGVFAFSEALLALAPISTPLQWLGVSPVATYNTLLLLSYPMAGLGAYALAFKLTKRHDASLIAALAFAFNPYRIAQLPHLQVEWSCWMPLALAALHDYIDTNRPRALVAFGACWMLNGFTNGYFLVYFPVLVAIWLLWFARDVRQWLSIGVTAALASLPLVPMLAGYVRWQHFHGLSRGIGEIRTFSADILAIFATAPRALASQWTLAPGPEGELYPGAAILLLTVVGVIVAVRRWRTTSERVSAARRVLIGLAVVAAALAIAVMTTGGSEVHIGSMTLSVHRPSRLLTFAFWMGVAAMATSPLGRRAYRARSVLAFYALAAAVTYFFAMGPEPRAGATQILYKPPYAWLLYVPGFDSVRVPARFGLLTLLCLCQTAAIVFSRITRSGLVFGKRVPISFLAVSGLILAEGWIPLPVVRLPPPIHVPERAISAGAYILELPVEYGFESNTRALFHATQHGRPIVNGFSGYEATSYYILKLAFAEADPTALAAVREMGPMAVYVTPDRETTDVMAALVADAPGAERLASDDPGQWFLLPAVQRAPAIVVSAAPVAIAQISATSQAEDAPVQNLIDGNIASAWDSDRRNDEMESSVTLTLEQPTVLDLIEIDQATWPGTYARDLEIVLTTPNGDVTVFRGSLAGLTYQATLWSRDVPLRIPIRAIDAATKVTLISHPAGLKWSWRATEIKLFAAPK